MSQGKTDEELKKWQPYKYVAQKQLEIKISKGGEVIPKTDIVKVEKPESIEAQRMLEANEFWEMVARHKDSKGKHQNPDEIEFYEAYHKEISQADSNIKIANH